MIQFEKVAGHWVGEGFVRQPDYRFVDCQRSVMPPLSSFRAERGEDPEPSGARERDTVADTVPDRLRRRWVLRSAPRRRGLPQDDDSGGWWAFSRGMSAERSDPAGHLHD